MFVIYDHRWSANEAPEAEIVRRMRPLLVINSFDAKISNGDWPIIGHIDIDAGYQLPTYKVKMGNEMYVENFAGDRRRIATTSEQHILQFRKGVGHNQIGKGAQRSLWSYGLGGVVQRLVGRRRSPVDEDHGLAEAVPCPVRPLPRPTVRRVDSPHEGPRFSRSRLFIAQPLSGFIRVSP